MKGTEKSYIILSGRKQGQWKESTRTYKVLIRREIFHKERKSLAKTSTSPFKMKKFNWKEQLENGQYFYREKWKVCLKGSNTLHRQRYTQRHCIERSVNWTECALKLYRQQGTFSKSVLYSMHRKSLHSFSIQCIYLNKTVHWVKLYTLLPSTRLFTQIVYKHVWNRQWSPSENTVIDAIQQRALEACTLQNAQD